MSDRKAHRGKRNPLSEEQRNQRQGLKYFIKLTSHHDLEKGEIVNVQPTGNVTVTLSDKKGKPYTTGCGNGWFLSETFGVFDSAVPPSWAFDGCVMDS
jgi:hypothetical protein